MNRVHAASQFNLLQEQCLRVLAILIYSAVIRMKAICTDCTICQEDICGHFKQLWNLPQIMFLSPCAIDTLVMRMILIPYILL